jgi:hypothetical protein
VELEIEGYKVNIDELKMESEELLEANHFAADTIRDKQVRNWFAKLSYPWVHVYSKLLQGFVS